MAPTFIKLQRSISNVKLRDSPIANVMKQTRLERGRFCKDAIYHRFGSDDNALFILIDPQTGRPAQAWKNCKVVTALKATHVHSLNVDRLVARFHVERLITNTKLDARVTTLTYASYLNYAIDEPNLSDVLAALLQQYQTQVRNSSARDRSAKPRVSFRTALELDPTMTRKEYDLIFCESTAKVEGARRRK